MQQRRSHHQELAGDVEVDLPHSLEVLEVLLGDERDGDVEDVEAVLADEVQQQVERALEVGQRDAEGVARGEHLVERLIWCRTPVLHESHLASLLGALETGKSALSSMYHG